MKRIPILSFILLLIAALVFIPGCDLFGPGTDDPESPTDPIDPTDPVDPVDPVDPTIPDTTAPGNVMALTAIPSVGGTIILSWTIPVDADFNGVEITWSDGGTDAVAIEAYTSTYTTAALTDGQSYTFTVKSVDTTGNISTGATATATADATPPAEVSILASCGTWIDVEPDGIDDYFDLDENHEGDGQLNVVWDNPAEGTTDLAGVLVSWTGATSSYVDDYPVYMNGSYQAQRECIVYDMLPETTYEFRLQAYDTAGNISEGIIVQGTTEYGWTELLTVATVADPDPYTITDAEYSSFTNGATYPMYSQPAASPAVTFVASYPTASPVEYQWPMIRVPAGSRLLIGALDPESSSTVGGFDLSTHFWVRAYMYAEGDEAGTADSTRPVGNVYIYLDYNGGTPDGSQTSCILMQTADSIEYATDYNSAYYYGAAKDLDGSMPDSGGGSFLNGVPSGTTTSYIMIYNDSDIDIYIKELRIQG